MKTVVETSTSAFSKEKSSALEGKEANVILKQRGQTNRIQHNVINSDIKVYVTLLICVSLNSFRSTANLFT